MINKAILIGNLGKDPDDLHTVVRNGSLHRFSIATVTNRGQDKTTEPAEGGKDRMAQHRLHFGRLAEICGELSLQLA